MIEQASVLYFKLMSTFLEKKKTVCPPGLGSFFKFHVVLLQMLPIRHHGQRESIMSGVGSFPELSGNRHSRGAHVSGQSCPGLGRGCCQEGMEGSLSPMGFIHSPGETFALPFSVTAR